MAWGGERRKLDHALATFSSEWLGILREVSSQPTLSPDLEVLSRRLGLSVSELACMPASAAFYRTFFADPSGVSMELWRRVFDPSGHFRAVADAPGRDQLIQDFAAAIRSGAFLAGVQLTLVAKLAQQHPTCVDAPLGARRIVGFSLARSRVLTCVRPRTRRVMPQARMGYADRVQYSPARSRRLSETWFSRSRLIDCCAIPSV